MGSHHRRHTDGSSVPFPLSYPPEGVRILCLLVATMTKIASREAANNLLSLTRGYLRILSRIHQRYDKTDVSRCSFNLFPLSAARYSVPMMMIFVHGFRHFDVAVCQQ
jgi:hypothetical protein